MKRMMHWALALTLVSTAACRPRQVELDTRTFRLEYLRGHEASTIIDPYVYGGRPDAPGYMSASEGAITVRETPDNLDKISRVLAEYDQPRADVRLHFQLIEADGFTDSDPRIEHVEAELRRIFQFGGYRLAGEAMVSATDGSEFMQGLRASDGRYEIQGQVYWHGGAIRLEGIALISEEYGRLLGTTLSIRPGQTLVLGTSPKWESTATLLLTLRAEEVNPSTN